MKSDIKSLTIFLILMIQVQFLISISITSSSATSSKSKDKSYFKNSLAFKNKLSFKSHQDNTKSENKDNEIDLNTYVGSTPVWKGWVKYFNYKTTEKFEQPKEFFVNNYFFKQRVVQKELFDKGPIINEASSEENNLYKNIPSKFSFFATLNNQYLEISGDRVNPLTSKLDSLNLDLIDPLNTTDIETRGLKELGNFDEGYCFDLSVHSLLNHDKDFIPTAGDYKTSTAVHWIICLEKESDYTKLISAITILINAREKIRERVTGETGKGTEEVEVNEEHYEGFDAKPLLDGYLVKINDWTKCTLKCGGGWSYQQWKCIPPKDGGHPCLGDLIRKKKCNEDPCPTINYDSKAAGKSTESEEVINDPIIKASYVTNRPQQNIDGEIREEDVLHEYKDKENGTLSIPSRLIMNSKSITLFSDLDTNKSVFTFDLKSTKFTRVLNQECCFFLKNENKEHKICGMSKCKTFVKSWSRSFDIFLSKTYNVLDVQIEDPSKQTEMNPTTSSNDNNLAMTMQMDETSAKATQQAISDKLKQKFSVQSNNEIDQTQKDALKVINREIDVEELIRREEMIRTQERIKSKMEEYKHEEKKKEKLEEALDQQSASQETLVNEIKKKQSILEIKKEAEKDVEERRNLLKKKLQKIRTLADRRTRLIQNKINIVRNKMTKDIVEATKNGDQKICKTAWGNETLMNKYCDDNVIDDLNKNIECKLNDNFCYSCCDNEFGKANLTGKEECYNLCLSKENIKGQWEKNELQEKANIA